MPFSTNRMIGWNIKRILKIMAFAIIVLVIAGYSYRQSRSLLSGPELIIITPQNGETIATSTAVIAGNTKNIAYIALNDRQIFTDENGDFSMTVLLLKGYNVVTVSVKDKFGREIKKSLQLVYKDESR